MTQQIKVMMWAAFIIGIAMVLNEQGLSSGASFGIVAGLAGAAIGSMSSRCGARGCM
ncbi:hypothetical protein [Erythrobacter litoralis]|uniref:Uncharacterized protein n=1 Tax=Erythrobacter litoralis (strain HTCC2594) TaxID=314225 RepID=Q2N6X2_ERYLH|nr:hypothetical protein [Erythrobacter litoralis]ABC64569.1 hypothetical protein ELI_12385 [Erythrobacter litoralis HTCC2594]